MALRNLLKSLAIGGTALLMAGCPPPPEDCTAPGDEDGNGQADCDDAACEAFPDCQEVDEICDDGQDNDGDGTVDCADGDCVNAPNCQEVEVCDNGVDDDGDGVADCADIDCAADPVCQGEICDDTIDNDGDGDTDCGDADCAADPACIEADCDDNVDNDGDGAVDCADGDCNNAPNCRPEDICDDNIDNDLDGDVDCADADCAADPICVPDTCGNGAIDAGEDCDGADLGGDDCTTIGGGFIGGTLACAANCTFDTAGCVQNINFDEIEPNNDQATANDFAAISTNNQATGEVNPSGDLDFFRVTIPAGGTGTITAETLDGPLGTTCVSNDVDSEIDLFDAAGVVLDNDDDDGDGFCSLATATGLPPGDYFIRVKASDFDPTLTFDYTLEIVVVVEICGDGVLAGIEECDDGNLTDGDGCESDCTITPVCGDGALQAGETCDDGNLTAGDGCDAICAVEPGFACAGEPSVCLAAVNEIEPNDDGTPNLNGGNGNDFDAAAAQILGFDAAAGDVLIAAALSPAGDEDGFAITNTGVNTVQITAETFGPGGPGTCVGVDTEINFRDAAGLELANDDESGINSCSLETFVLAPGGEVFVHVVDFLDNTEVPSYFLQLRFADVICGDGAVAVGEGCDDGNLIDGDGCDAVCAVEPGFSCVGAPSVCTPNCGNGVLNVGETCDDGNLIDGDGCDALCQLEGVISEIEPNDDGTPDLNGGNGNDFNAAAAQILGFDAAAGDVLIAAALNPAGDEDGFAITNTGVNTVIITAETFGPGGVGTCNIDTEINFRDAAGTELANDDEGGINSCSLETFVLAPGGEVFVHVIDFLDNTQVNLYFLELRFADVICGDGVVVAGSEGCDDGNTAAGDGCDAVCAVEPGFVCSGAPSVCVPSCGDGIVNGTDQCDGAALGGNDCTDVGFAGGTLACAADCTFDTTNCTNIICGDGIISAGEQCDDGNVVDGDGCDSACAIEGAVAEIEPNEDGTPQTGGAGVNGNDFDAGGIASGNALANGAFSLDAIIFGALDPAGDEDVFAIENPGSATVEISLNIFNAALGLGVACGTTIDTALTIRNATGAIVNGLQNDDRNGAADRCSALSFALAPGETVFAHVTEFGDDAAIAGYLLEAVFVEVVCGNGVLQAGEQCDDGNVINGDGCDDTCQIEGIEPEVEPNGSVAEADANGIIITDDVIFTGSITDVTDELDFYRVEIAAAPAVVRFELFTSVGNCDATTTTLRLRDAAGTQIISDNTTGIRSCSAIQFPFETAGTFYIQVEETGTNASIPTYFLEANFIDDTGAETEPNEDSATANINIDGLSDVFVSGDHSVNADSDFYAITVPAGASIRAEIIEGNRTVETCESNGVDSRLTLFNAAGTQLVDDDDDGRGFCSLIDGTGTTPLDIAAKNNTGADAIFFLQVRASSFSQANAAGQFIYRLALTVR